MRKITEPKTRTTRSMESKEIAVKQDVAADLFEFIQAKATDPSFDVEKFKELITLAEHVQDRQAAVVEADRKRTAQQAYNDALRAAQEEMKPIVRDAQNRDTSSKYAKMETIDKAIRPIYIKHGFALSFGAIDAAQLGNVKIVCHMGHSAGDSRDYYLEAPPDTTGPKGGGVKTGIQGVGSTVSYLRKYIKLMIFDLTLVDEDNDGQGSDPIESHELVAVTKIYKACEMNETEVEGFLTFMGITALSEIRRHDYEKAMNMLRAKFSQKSKERRTRA